MKIGYRERMKGNNNPNYRHGAVPCQKCGGVKSRNAKQFCLKCRGEMTKGADNPFYGKTHSKKQKQKWSKERKGREPTWKGGKHTVETRQLLSTQAKNRMKNPEYKRKMLKGLKQGLEVQLLKKETKPERMVGVILNELGVKWERNTLLYDKFYVDFLLANGRVIEVFGDYWHGNPNVFHDLNEHQIKQTKKDKSRIAYLAKCKRKLLVIWEYDIKHNIDRVKEKLKEFVQ